MASFTKEAISASAFPFKTRRLRRPLKITTLLKKIGANPISPPPSPISGTKGAGGMGVSSAPKTPTGLSSPAPQQTTVLQRNLLAQSGKPGQFTGFTTKTRMGQAGSLGKLGVPPAVSAPNVRLAALKIAAGQATPAPAVPPTSGRSFMPGTSGSGTPPPPPVATGGGAPFPEGGIPAPQAPVRPPAPPSPSSDVDWSGFKAPESGAWDKTKRTLGEIGGQFADWGNPLNYSMLVPGLGIPSAVANAAWGPIKGHIQRTEGAPKPGEVVTGNKSWLWDDVPAQAQSEADFLTRAGYKSRQEFMDASQQDPKKLLESDKAPYIMRLAMYHGLVPGAGKSTPNEVATSGEWIPEYGMYSGEIAAMQKTIEQGMQNQEQDAQRQAEEEARMLEEYRRRSGTEGMVTTASFNPALLIKAVAAERPGDRSFARSIKAAAMCDRLIKIGAVRPMEKRALGLVGKLLGGAGLLGLGAASAVTPSEQTVPGMGTLGRFGLGALGAYGGWRAADAMNLPWWAKPFAALAGSQVVPGVAGSIMGGGQPGTGLGNILQNPLLWGGGMYLASQNPKIREWLEKNFPGGRMGGIAAAGLLGPSVPGMLGLNGQGGILGGLMGGSPAY